MAKRILVVDDSATQRAMILDALQGAPYSVSTAENGAEAISKAEQEKPDIIVLDVIMPEQNGFQVCRQLKKNASTEAIKIILLTSKSQETDKFWGMKQGADDYLTKPFDPADLALAIEKQL